jgi:hypothetical protein
VLSAVRAPSYLQLGIVVALTGGTIAIMPPPLTGPPPVMPEPAAEEPSVGAQLVAPRTRACEVATTIVVRGYSLDDSFSIQLAGKRHRYSAISNDGYFELRIPVDDFDGDVCTIPSTFGDDQTTLRFSLDLE